MNAGCALTFFSSFLVLGLVATAAMFWGMVRPVWRANFVYVENRCEVLDKRVVTLRGNKGNHYRPEIHIKYTVAERAYQVWTYDAGKVSSSSRASKQKIIDQFEVGREYPCWYDPGDPSRAVLVRGWSWVYLVFPIPLLFVLVGVAGIYGTLRAKRGITEAWAGRDAGSLGAAPTPAAASDRHPTVPEIDLSNRPGRTLRYELSAGVSRGWALLGFLAITVIWNGVTWPFVVMAWSGALGGLPRWAMLLFMAPFVLVGLVLVVAFIKELLVAAGVGPTRMEISDHPLEPGGAYVVWISQSGNLQVNALWVELVCEEQVSYRQGTSTRNENKQVFVREMYRNEGFEIRKEVPFEARFEVHVPQAAMHSFEAAHNKIRWLLRIKGDIAGWPDFAAAYPVVVLPGEGGGE